MGKQISYTQCFHKLELAMVILSKAYQVMFQTHSFFQTTSAGF